MIPLADGKHYLIACDLQAVGTPQPKINSMDFEPGRFSSVPRRLLLVPWGPVSSKSGTFTINDESFRSMRAAHETSRMDIPIDYEHQILGTGPAPAAGWINRLTHLPGKGIYGDVSWTPQSARYIYSRAYQYFSPVLKVRKADGVAIGLHSVALTNHPAIVSMPSITSSGPPPGMVPHTAPKAAASKPAAPTKPKAPRFIKLCPWGRFTGKNGKTNTFDEISTTLVERQISGGPIEIDHNHWTVGGEYDAQEPLKYKFGHLTAILASKVGVFGRVKWNLLGEEAVNRELLRHVSPTFHEISERVVGLHSIALTNAPNLYQGTIKQEAL